MPNHRAWQHHPYRHWHEGPPWAPGLAHKRRFLLLRFAGLFGGLILIFLVAFAVALALILGSSGAGPYTPVLLLLGACGVPFLFLVVAALAGSLAFRRIGRPIADLMAAADSIANGDLSVRVDEHIPGEFGRLASRFNRMTAELERAEQRRHNMTADIAHELRTPLHIIQGNLEGIVDGVYEPTGEHIAATLEETRLLTRLVNDLQTLSLAEAGQLPLHPVRFAAADLLADVAASFAGPAAEQGVDLRVEAPDDARGLELNADPDRLDQVLSNLVANSLRYTPPGGRITLRAAPAPGPAGVRLTVADTGTGIPQEDLPYVFDRFWRGDRSRARVPGTGSGLGLAIAKQLVLAHGGTINVDSQPGQGTVFTIEL
jgi:two-component system sensor histidine kinase BaeS